MWAGFMAITWILMLIKTEPSFLCSTLSCCNGKSWTRLPSQMAHELLHPVCGSVGLQPQEASNQPGSTQDSEEELTSPHVQTRVASSSFVCY